MPATGSDPEVAAGFDDEVAIVGGGPAGCSAVRRCAHLENYRGFPAGIDIETLYELMHDHVETAGCELIPDLVGSVERTDDGDGFIVEPQDEAVEAYVTEHGFVKARGSR